jgi:hypothetical protein
VSDWNKFAENYRDAAARLDRVVDMMLPGALDEGARDRLTGWALMAESMRATARGDCDEAADLFRRVHAYNLDGPIHITIVANDSD